MNGESSREYRERWQRREKRRKAERERLKKHGAGLRRVYRDAVLKRLRAGKHR